MSGKGLFILLLQLASKSPLIPSLKKPPNKRVLLALSLDTEVKKLHTRFMAARGRRLAGWSAAGCASSVGRGVTFHDNWCKHEKRLEQPTTPHRYTLLPSAVDSESVSGSLQSEQFKRWFRNTDPNGFNMLLTSHSIFCSSFWFSRLVFSSMG